MTLSVGSPRLFESLYEKLAELPVVGVAEGVVNSMENNNATILSSATGSGEDALHYLLDGGSL